jgi:DNA repair protein RadD
MMRPMMSASLYVQMAGRGLRPKSQTDHCLVLDFAGVVEMHGPITAVQPPKKGSLGDGEAPVKVCDECGELCPISVQVCPACGAAFPEPVAKAMTLRNDDIMGIEGTDMEITSWFWRKHLSRASGKEMITCTMYGNLSDSPITSYYAITHDGYAGEKARKNLAEIAHKAGVSLDYSFADLHDIAKQITEGKPPQKIEYRKDGKFYRVISHQW